jgi:hypothetical protein
LHIDIHGKIDTSKTKRSYPRSNTLRKHEVNKMNKDMNSNTTTTQTKKKKHKQKIVNVPMHQMDNKQPNKVDSFATFANSLPQFGKGLAWILGTLLVTSLVGPIVINIWTGQIPLQNLWELFVAYLTK